LLIIRKITPMKMKAVIAYTIIWGNFADNHKKF